MAKLQKTLDVAPSVASAGAPKPASTLTADAIKGAGDLASGVILDVKKSGLEEELTSLGTAASAVREGLELEEATEEFKRLKAAKKQGIFSDSFVNVQAEKILKQKIGANSVFAPELRKAAADILGFDPTGSEVQALFGKTGRTSASRPLTLQEKRKQRAEGISAITGTPVADLEKIMANAEENALRLEAVTNQAAIGNASSAMLLNTTLDASDDYLADAINIIQTEIANGGIVTPEQYGASFIEARENAWRNHRATQKQAGIVPSGDQLAQERSVLEAHYAPMIEMAESGTMETILTRQNNTLSAEIGIRSVEKFRGISLVNKAMGQAGVSHYLTMSTKIKDPAMLKLLKERDPALAAVLDNITDADKIVAASYNKVMGITPEANSVQSNLVIEEQIAADVVAEEEDPVIRERVTEWLQGQGKPFRVLSFYAQPGARVNSTPAEVDDVKTIFGREFEPLMSRMASRLSAFPNVSMSVVNGKLSVQVKTEPLPGGRAAPAFAPQSGSSLLPTDMKLDIDRLNSMSQLVRNGFAKDVNQEVFGFAERTANKIEALRADNEPTPNGVDDVVSAIEAWEKNPTPENLEILRGLDSQLVHDAESASAQLGGGSNGDN